MVGGRSPYAPIRHHCLGTGYGGAIQRYITGGVRELPKAYIILRMSWLLRGGFDIVAAKSINQPQVFVTKLGVTKHLTVLY